MQMHEDLTGYALDVLAGLPPTNSDDAEQVNKATTYGLNVSYRHVVKLLTDRDVVEVGALTRIDSIQQSDTRLFPDGTINTRNVDASIGATSIAGYVDAAIYPFKRFVVRGGTRLDSLSYSVDRPPREPGHRADVAGAPRRQQGDGRLCGRRRRAPPGELRRRVPFSRRAGARRGGAHPLCHDPELRGRSALQAAGARGRRRSSGSRRGSARTSSSTRSREPACPPRRPRGRAGPRRSRCARASSARA